MRHQIKSSQIINHQKASTRHNIYHKPMMKQSSIVQHTSLEEYIEEEDLREKFAMLAKQNQMKRKALQKASKMIQLLDQDRNQILKKYQHIRSVLKISEQNISVLNQKLSQAQYRIEELTQQLKNIKQQTNKGVITSSTLFFSFTQPKIKSNVCRSKVFEPNTLVPKPSITISEQFTPWSAPHSQIIESLKETVSNQQMQKGQFHQFNTLIKKQRQNSQKLKNMIQLKNQKIQDQLQDSKEMQRSFQLRISQTKFTTQESQNKMESTLQLIRQYERIINQLKQYSSYIKAHLCQSISFISKISPLSLITSPYQYWNPNLIKNVIEQLIQIVSYRLQYCQDENHQLHSIIVGLINNFSEIKERKKQINTYPSILYK